MIKRHNPNLATTLQCSYSRRMYRTLGTLADPTVPGITCSDFVARRVMKQFEVIPFESFERAAEAVEVGDIDAFFVPGAYRDVAKFIQSDKFTLTKCIVVPIPALVFAGLSTNPPLESAVVYYQPATESLLPEIPSVAAKTITVSSNAVACRSVLDAGGTATTITNQPCADYFSLNTYCILRSAQPMPFFLFRAARKNN